jgi:Ssp1 endopeptidase immunity protein Rap1a
MPVPKISRLLAVVLFTWVAVFSVRPAAAVPSISVEEAVDICRAGFAPPDGQAASAARRSMCIALIDGVVGTIVQIAAMAGTGKSAAQARAGLFCIPGDEPYERLSDVFVRFARENTRYRDRAAAAIFVAAFAAKYPCS